MTIKTLIVGLALLAVSSLTLAQDVNTQRCQALSTDLQKSLATSVQDRTPKQDPGSYNQENSDIKGLLSTDVSAGFSKLMNLDFGSIIDGLVNKAMSSAMQKGASTFNSKINGVLSSVGVSAVKMVGLSGNNSVSNAINQTTQNTINSAVQNTSSTADSLVNNAAAATKTNAGKVVTPYGG